MCADAGAKKDIWLMATHETIHQLVKELMEGKQEAFNELFLMFQRPIYYLAMRMLANHNDADEIVQKTFLQVHQSIQGFRSESSFKTWLYRIAINQCKDHLKSKEQRVSKMSIDNPIFRGLKEKSQSPIQKLIQQDRTQVLIKIINQLSQQQKTTVMLRVFEDMAFKEIASVLDCTESTAKVHYHQALVKMKSLFKETHNDL